MSDDAKTIYLKTKARNLVFRHVCEVGVYLPETSNVLDFIKDGVRATLVEADPVTVEKIRTYFKAYAIQLFPVAIWDSPGKLRLAKAGASTFAVDLKASPALVNNRYVVQTENTFEVECRVFSDMDDGTIDLLSIDIEGGEWYVLKHLRSRPKVLSIETHGKLYTNPFIAEITAWMKANNYAVWYRDASDTVFVQAGLLTPDTRDRLETAMAGIHVQWKRLAGAIKRTFGRSRNRGDDRPGRS